MTAITFYLVSPVVAAFAARRHAVKPELRDLCAALGAAEVAGAIASGTFDSFSFPMFYNLQALIVGLVSAMWLIVQKEKGNILIYESEGN